MKGERRRIGQILIFAVFVTVLAFVSVGCVSGATAPEEEWNRTFGGICDDEAHSVQQTADGGYIIAGSTYSYSAGYDDVWLVKMDSKGNEQWNKTFGGPYYDGGWRGGAKQTADGGYILASTTASYGAGSYDFWLIKTDSAGKMMWNKTFGGTSSDVLYSFQQTTDGGFILAGWTWSYGAGNDDAWLVKTDSNGNEQWNKTFGTADREIAFSVQQTTDGGYIFTATHHLVKTDSNGNELWNKTYSGYAYSIGKTADGGYIFAGTTSAGDPHFWLEKTDSEGNEQWNKTFRGNGTEVCSSIQQTADGGYVLAGDMRPYGSGGEDIWLIKTNYKGTKEWDKTLGGSDRDWASSVLQNTEGDYIIAGYTGWSLNVTGSKDAWLIKVKGELAEPPVRNTNTGENFSSIQVAIEDLNTLDGHTIMVNPGIYSESVVVNKPLILKGIGMPVLKPGGDWWHHSDGITVVVDGCVIEGFNITGIDYWDDASINVSSDNNIIRNNTIYRNDGEGIYLRDSSHNVIENNAAIENKYGLVLERSSCNTIINNIADSNNNGIRLGPSSNNNTITNNNVNSNNNGICLYSSSDNILIYNTAESNNGRGILIDGTEKSHFDNVIDTTNTVNGRPVYYYFDEHYQVLDGLDTTHLTLAYCSHFTVNNCNVSNGDGFLLAYSSYNTIKNSVFSNNNGFDGGISLLNSNYNTILNNNANNNEAGTGTIILGSNNIVTDNNASYNLLGIGISGSNNTIMNNIVSNNEYYGIYLMTSSNNTIYENYFNNTNNAYDNGNNIWNITKTSGTNIIGGSWLGGNYWSDCTGKDTNGDGLGDTLLPYNSSGNILSGGDWLPLVKDLYTNIDVGVTSTITIANSSDIAAYLPPEYDGVDISDAVVLNVDVTDDTPSNPADDAYTDITITVGTMNVATCKVFKSDLGFLPEVGDVTALPMVKPPGEPAFSRNVANNTVTVRLYVGDPLLAVLPSAALTFRLDLVTGLNLISMPINDVSITTAASLAAKLGPNCSEVIAFNATQQQLQSYVPGVPLNNFAIVGGAGYFVNLNNPTPVILTGSGWPSPFSVELVSGLNLVGMPVNDTAVTTASTLAAKIGTSCQEVVNWERGTQSYVSYVTGVPLNDFAIQAGDGYFVTVTDQTEVTFEGDSWEN